MYHRFSTIDEKSGLRMWLKFILAMWLGTKSMSVPVTSKYFCFFAFLSFYLFIYLLFYIYFEQNTANSLNEHG